MADEYEEIETEESEARYAKNKYEARGNLFDAKLRDNKIQRADAIAAAKQNAKAAENEWWGSKLGGWGSAGMAFALGLANPFALAAIAAGGSYFGGKKGAENVGGYADVEDIRETTFFQDSVEDTRDDVLAAEKSAESSRLMEAGSTAFSVYNIAGGPLPGTSSATSKVEMALADDLTQKAALSQLTEKYVSEGMIQAQAEELATENVAKAFLPVKGIDGKLAVPDFANIAELGGKDVGNISNLNVLWENITNPKAGNIREGSLLGDLGDNYSKSQGYAITGTNKTFPGSRVAQATGATLWDLFSRNEDA